MPNPVAIVRFSRLKAGYESDAREAGNEAFDRIDSKAAGNEAPARLARKIAMQTYLSSGRGKEHAINAGVSAALASADAERLPPSVGSQRTKPKLNASRTAVSTVAPSVRGRCRPVLDPELVQRMTKPEKAAAKDKMDKKAAQAEEASKAQAKAQKAEEKAAEKAAEAEQAEAEKARKRAARKQGWRKFKAKHKQRKVRAHAPTHRLYPPPLPNAQRMAR